MGELGLSRFENRRDIRGMVTSGRVHGGSPEFVTRAAPGGKKGSKKWGVGLSDPEVKRRKRIVKYKVYSVEGKVKASFRKGLHWFKNKVSELVHGY